MLVFFSFLNIFYNFKKMLNSILIYKINNFCRVHILANCITLIYCLSSCKALRYQVFSNTRHTGVRFIPRIRGPIWSVKATHAQNKSHFSFYCFSSLLYAGCLPIENTLYLTTLIVMFFNGFLSKTILL